LNSTITGSINQKKAKKFYFRGVPMCNHKKKKQQMIFLATGIDVRNKLDKTLTTFPGGLVHQN